MFLLSFFFYAFILPAAVTFKCVEQDPPSPCTCETVWGDVLNFSAFSKGKIFEANLTASNLYFRYNPCIEVPCNESNTSLCMQNGSTSERLGQINKGNYNEPRDSSIVGIAILYKYGIDSMAEVLFVCKEGVDGNFTIVNVSNSSLMQFIIETQHVCFGPPPTPIEPSKPHPGISVGSIIILAVIVVVAVYFGGGILFKVFYKKEKGLQAIPHGQFWASIFLNIQSGILFVTKGIQLLFKRKNSAYENLAPK